jgi:hypothetical protein
MPTKGAWKGYHCSVKEKPSAVPQPKLDNARCNYQDITPQSPLNGEAQSIFTFQELALTFAVSLFMFFLVYLFLLSTKFSLLLLGIIFCWRHILLQPFLALLLLLLLHLGFTIFTRLALFCLPAEEILSALNLQINLALLLWRREWRVDFLRLVCDFVGHAALAESALFEVGEEAVPALVCEFRVLC